MSNDAAERSKLLADIEYRFGRLREQHALDQHNYNRAMGQRQQGLAFLGRTRMAFCTLNLCGTG